LDGFWVGLYVGESSEERSAQRGGILEESVVRAGLAGVVPEPFGRVEFRRVGGEQEDFDVAAVLAQPVPDLGLLLRFGRV